MYFSIKNQLIYIYNILFLDKECSLLVGFKPRHILHISFSRQQLSSLSECESLQEFWHTWFYFKGMKSIKKSTFDVSERDLKQRISFSLRSYPSPKSIPRFRKENCKIVYFELNINVRTMVI